jgi:hypothetical protein
MRTMHTRLCKLQDLMECWKLITYDMFSNRSSNIRVDITIHTKMVINGHQLCSELDLLRIGNLKNTLGEPFGIRSCAMDKFLYWCHFYIIAFAS